MQILTSTRQGMCTCDIHCSLTCTHVCCPKKQCSCWCHAFKDTFIRNTGINGCDHICSIPFTRKGELIAWQCECGKKKEFVHVTVEEKEFLQNKYRF